MGVGTGDENKTPPRCPSPCFRPSTSLRTSPTPLTRARNSSDRPAGLAAKLVAAKFQAWAANSGSDSGSLEAATQRSAGSVVLRSLATGPPDMRVDIRRFRPAGKGPVDVSLGPHRALGTDKFRATPVTDHALTATARAWEISVAQEVRNLGCEKRLHAWLHVTGKQQSNAADVRSGAAWKDAGPAWMLRGPAGIEPPAGGASGLGRPTHLSQVGGAVTRSAPAVRIAVRLSSASTKSQRARLNRLFSPPFPPRHAQNRRPAGPRFFAPPPAHEPRSQSNTTVLFPYTNTRPSRCHRTACASTVFSRSRPLRIRSSTSCRCVTRATSWLMIGPSSRSRVA